MKSIGSAAISALFLLILPSWAAAQPYASGSYHFLTEADGPVRFVEFEAITDERGNTAGVMTFVDPTEIADFDEPDETPEGKWPPELYLKAQIDELVVEKNRAFMSGYIVDSSHRTYIGKWVQLVVEDNAENRERPDLLTWSWCRPQPGGWVPSDAELDHDDGAYLSWWATDAERRDDVGIPSPSLIPDEKKRCTAYPLWSYSFIDLLKWEGDIIVRP